MMRLATSKDPAGSYADRAKVLSLATRNMWIDLAKKTSVETTCKQTRDATKASLAAYGCSF